MLLPIPYELVAMRTRRGEALQRLRPLERIRITVSADEKNNESDDAGEDKQRTNEQSQAEATGEDGAAAGDGGARWDVGGAERCCEIAINAVVGAEAKRAEEQSNVSGDGAVRVGGHGSEEHGHISADVSFDIDGAEGTGYIAGSLTFFDVDGGEESDSIVAGTVGSVAQERKGKDGGEQKFRHAADLKGKSVGRVQAEL